MNILKRNAASVEIGLEVPRFGTAGLYIHHLPDLIREMPKPKIVVYASVPSRQGDWGSQLDDQISTIFKVAKHYNSKSKILSIFRDFPQHRAERRNKPCQFSCAVKAAKESGAIVVARSTFNFLKGRGETRINFAHTAAQRAAITEFTYLDEIANDVTLATALHPDTPRPQYLAYLKKRRR